jgi:hypothetical protein
MLPYGTTTMPTFTYEVGIEGQIVNIENFTSNNSNGQTVNYYGFIVTAPDEETSVQYDLYVTVALNPDCALQSLLIQGTEIPGFHADTTAYQIIYPIGTDSTDLITKEDITPICNDSNATIVVLEDDYDFTIIVTAHDGEHTRVYTIEQIILLSSNAMLSDILLDSVSLREFDALTFDYTHYITNAVPTVQAIAQDSTAAVEYGMYIAGEPFYIYVTAQDGSEQIYTINFVQSTIQTAATPTANDVIIKHIAGTMDFAVATIRKNVSIGIYSSEGHLVYYSKVAESNQNDAVVITNTDGSELLLDAYNTTIQFS